MRRHFFTSIAVLFLLATASRVSRAACGEELAVSHALRVGASVRVLLPNAMPGFSRNLLAYGIALGVPVGPGSVFLEVNYGSESGLRAFLAETNYRVWLRTPYFVPYFQGGLHFLRYSSGSGEGSGFGGNVGLGLVLSLDRTFEFTFGAQAYLRSQWILSMGGGFNFRF